MLDYSLVWQIEVQDEFPEGWRLAENLGVLKEGSVLITSHR